MPNFTSKKSLIGLTLSMSAVAMPANAQSVPQPSLEKPNAVAKSFAESKKNAGFNNLELTVGYAYHSGVEILSSTGLPSDVQNREFRATFSGAYGINEKTSLNWVVPLSTNTTSYIPNSGAPTSSSNSGEITLYVDRVLLKESGSVPLITGTVGTVLAPFKPGTSAGVFGAVQFAKTLDPIVLAAGLSVHRPYSTDLAGFDLLVAVNAQVQFVVSPKVTFDAGATTTWVNALAGDTTGFRVRESTTLDFGGQFIFSRQFYVRPQIQFGIGQGSTPVRFSLAMPLNF